GEVLRQARRRRWPILHVHRREAGPHDGRPIPGLEPLPSEPIYLRPGASAFSHQGFAHAAQGLAAPLALIGFSLGDSILATTFAALDRGLPVDILTDAVFAAEDETVLHRAIATTVLGLSVPCRFTSSTDLFREEAATICAANAP
ncbi:MAG TPA: isochorismatase family protein, partial [Phenylobacterium sp.]|uniref:isochorismatase family protein n=1 Tax=Phenylobacterium sp. TaxID=1871053 RepID=UPI002F926984